MVFGNVIKCFYDNEIMREQWMAVSVGDIFNYSLQSNIIFLRRIKTIYNLWLNGYVLRWGQETPRNLLVAMHGLKQSS